MTSPAASARRHAPAVAGLAAVTAVLLWPALRWFSTRMLAGTGDANLFIWAWWHVPRALLEGRNALRTQGLFFPVGVDLGFHTFTPAVMVVVWPVARALGWGAAVNLDQLGAALGSAVAMYFLALRVCDDRRAAFVAGVAYAFMPYRFVHLPDHLNLIHMWTLPLGLLTFLRLRQRPSAGRAVALGAVAGITFLTEAQYAVFLAVAVAVLAWRLPRPEGSPALGPGWPALALGVAAVVAAPLAAGMAGALLRGELDPAGGWGGADAFSADLLSWVTPSPAHPLWGAPAARVYGGLRGGLEGLAYPGLLVLALAVVGREFVPRALRRGWVALAAAGFVLSLGPFLQVGGHSGGLFHLFGTGFVLPLPFALLRFVPVLNGLRVPGRFAVVGAVALGVLMATTLAALMRRPGRWWPRAWVGVLAVTLMEFLPGALPHRPVAVPRPYHAIAASPDTRAVLEIPLQWSFGAGAVGDLERENSILLYYPTVHRRPVVSGSTSRYPRERQRRLESIPVYRQVLTLQAEPGYFEAVIFTGEDLCRLGLGFVVYHRDRPVDAARAYLETLQMPVLDDDGTVLVWSVPDCRR